MGRFSSASGRTPPPNVADACQVCPDGFVAPETGSGFCRPCPAGTSSRASTTDVAAASTCGVCPAGTASLPGSAACVARYGVNGSVDTLFAVEALFPTPSVGASARSPAIVWRICWR